MGISYKGFRYKLDEYNIKAIDVSRDTGISPGVFTKLKNDEYVNLNTLELLCKYFRDKYNDNCNFGDLIEYIGNSTKK